MDNPILTVGLLSASTYFFHQAWSSPSQPTSKDVHKNDEAGITPSLVKAYLRWLQIPFSIWNLTWIVMIALQQYEDAFGASVGLPCETLCHKTALPESSGGSMPSFSALSPSALVGLVLVILGGALRVWAFYELGVHFTFVVVIREKHELIKSGPYAFVRHPSYSAFILIWPGLLLAYMNPLSNDSSSTMIHCFLWAQGLILPDLSSSWSALARVAAVWIFRALAAEFIWCWSTVGNPLGRMKRIRHEEEILHKAFGEEWVAYTKRTKILVPWIY